MEIIVWLIISFVAWPATEFLWKKVIFPFIEWPILSVGKKGFVPLFINLASSIFWMSASVIVVNVLSFIASISPESSEIFGIKVVDLSTIIPIELLLSLIVGALSLNAITHKWNK